MGIYFDYSNIRYNIFVFYLLIGSTSYIIYVIYSNSNIFKYLSISVLLIIYLFSGIKYPITKIYSGIKQNMNYYPEIASIVDTLSEEKNLKAGLAEYWTARVVTMFSKKNIVVNHAYLGSLSPYHFLNRIDNYLYTPKFKDSILIYNFIVYHESIDTSFLISTFGNYEKINCKNHIIIRTRDFTFDKNNLSIILK